MNIIMKTCMRNNIHKRSLRSQCLARIDVCHFHDLLPVKLITMFIFMFLTGHLCLLVYLQTLPLHHHSLESLHHPM